MNKISQSVENAAALAVGAVTISQLHAIAKMEEVSAELEFLNVLPDDMQETILKDRKKNKRLQIWLGMVPAIPFGLLVAAILVFCIAKPDNPSMSPFVMCLLFGVPFMILWFAITMFICIAIKRKEPCQMYHKYFDKHIWPAFMIGDAFGEDETYWEERVTEWTKDLYEVLTKSKRGKVQ